MIGQRVKIKESSLSENLGVYGTIIDYTDFDEALVWWDNDIWCLTELGAKHRKYEAVDICAILLTKVEIIG